MFILRPDITQHKAAVSIPFGKCQGASNQMLPKVILPSPDDLSLQMLMFMLSSAGCLPAEPARAFTQCVQGTPWALGLVRPSQSWP